MLIFVCGFMSDSGPLFLQFFKLIGECGATDVAEYGGDTGYLILRGEYRRVFFFCVSVLSTVFVGLFGLSLTAFL